MRNTLPKFGPFLLWHPVYIYIYTPCIYIYIYIYKLINFVSVLIAIIGVQVFAIAQSNQLCSERNTRKLYSRFYSILNQVVFYCFCTANLSCSLGRFLWHFILRHNKRRWLFVDYRVWSAGCKLHDCRCVLNLRTFTSDLPATSVHQCICEKRRLYMELSSKPEHDCNKCQHFAADWKLEDWVNESCNVTCVRGHAVGEGDTLIVLCCIVLCCVVLCCVVLCCVECNSCGKRENIT